MFREIGNVYNRQYYEDYISSVFNAGDTVNWGQVAWLDSTPAGTEIRMYVRSGNDSIPDSLWSGWVEVRKGDSIPDSLNSRYLQYKAVLSYTTLARFPVLWEVSISYGPRAYIVVDPDQAGSGCPRQVKVYDLHIINNSFAADTIWLSSRHSHPRFQVEIHDSAGPIIDYVFLPRGGRKNIQAQVIIPDSILYQTVDTTYIIGRSNSHPALRDSARLITSVEFSGNISVDPDYYDSLYAGDSILYRLTVQNNTNLADTIRLSSYHTLPGWQAKIVDGLGNIIDRVYLRALGGQVYIGVWVKSPLTAPLGETDTTIVLGNLRTFPQVKDSAELKTRIKTRGNILIEPNQSSNILPGQTIAYQLVVINLGNTRDTVDITSRHTRPGWLVGLFDSTGINPLIDHNSNGIPDIGEILPQDSVKFIVKITAPANALMGQIDTTYIRATSGMNPSIYDEAELKTQVLGQPNLSVEPDQTDSTLPGASINYRLKVRNLGNLYDLIDLYNQGTRPGWTVRLLDTLGNSLIDHNGNGLVDVGPLPPFNGEIGIIAQVTPPSNVLRGVVDTTQIWGQSGTNSSVRERAVLMTIIAGDIISLLVEPECTNRVEPGGSAVYRLEVKIDGNISDVVDIDLVRLPGGWVAEVFDSSSNNRLIDTDFDNKIDVGEVKPDIKKEFVVKITAPPWRGLIGKVDSLTGSQIAVWGYSSRKAGLKDSASLKTLIVPPLDVHNYASPFKERTQFIFSLPDNGRVDLEIYNRAGELVRVLIRNEYYNFGIHTRPWDGRNDAGKRCAPGLYLYLFSFRGSDGKLQRIQKKTVIER